MLKKLRPIVFKGSRVPRWLGKILPIEPTAISFFVFVWVVFEQPDRRLIDHETIHFQQQLELLFVGQWLLYALFHLKGLFDWRDGRQAYINNPFEREAYYNQANSEYLSRRSRYAWVHYI